MHEDWNQLQHDALALGGIGSLQYVLIGDDEVDRFRWIDIIEEPAYGLQFPDRRTYPVRGGTVFRAGAGQQRITHKQLFGSVVLWMAAE